MKKRTITHWMRERRGLGYAFAAAATTYCGLKLGSAEVLSAAVAVAGAGVWDIANRLTTRLETLVTDRFLGLMRESSESLECLFREIGIPYSEKHPPEHMKLYGIVARIDQHIKEIGALPQRPLDGDKSAVDLQHVIGG